MSKKEIAAIILVGAFLVGSLVYSFINIFLK